MTNKGVSHYLSVISVLCELEAKTTNIWLSKKIYIGNGFDVVPHCKHFQPSANLLATANKGRTHRKVPVERPVRRAFELDWENS